MPNQYQLELHQLTWLHTIQQRCQALIFEDNFKIITSYDADNAVCKLNKVIIENIDKNYTFPGKSVFDMEAVRDLEFRFIKDKILKQNICQAVIVTRGEAVGESKKKREDEKILIKVEKEHIINTYNLDISTYKFDENEPHYPSFQEWLNDIHIHYTE